MIKSAHLVVRLEPYRMAKLRRLASEMNSSLSAIVRALIDSAHSDQIHLEHGDGTTVESTHEEVPS